MRHNELAMTAGTPSAALLADRVRDALESGDLAEYAELLSPDVTWGAPGDPNPTCRNRNQVLTWYQRGQDAGTTARVTEVSAVDDKLLVGLMVRRGGDYGERWQILTVGPQGISDIRGFEDRRSAAEYAGI
jgi:ketosteroid isomerase-like protein